MATIDKINIENTVYDISTTSVTTVTLGGRRRGEDVGVLIDENTKEIDILVVSTNLVPDVTARFSVGYLNENTTTEIFSLYAWAESDSGIDCMGKLIKTSTGSLKGLFIADSKQVGIDSEKQMRMTLAAEATNFSSKHTLVLTLTNAGDYGNSWGTADLLIVEKK